MTTNYVLRSVADLIVFSDVEVDVFPGGVMGECLSFCRPICPASQLPVMRYNRHLWRSITNTLVRAAGHVQIMLIPLSDLPHASAKRG